MEINFDDRQDHKLTRSQENALFSVSTAQWSAILSLDDGLFFEFNRKQDSWTWLEIAMSEMQTHRRYQLLTSMTSKMMVVMKMMVMMMVNGGSPVEQPMGHRGQDAQEYDSQDAN